MNADPVSALELKEDFRMDVCMYVCVPGGKTTRTAGVKHEKIPMETLPKLMFIREDRRTFSTKITLCKFIRLVRSKGVDGAGSASINAVLMRRIQRKGAKEKQAHLHSSIYQPCTYSSSTRDSIHVRHATTYSYAIRHVSVTGHLSCASSVPRHRGPSTMYLNRGEPGSKFLCHLLNTFVQSENASWAGKSTGQILSLQRVRVRESYAVQPVENSCTAWHSSSSRTYSKVQ